MLRASANAHSITVELRSISDPTVDSGLPGGAALLAATDAAVLRDDLELADAREELVGELGEAAATRAFAVAGNFEMMNRLLDGQGVMPRADLHPIGEAIGRPFVAHH